MLSVAQHAMDYASRGWRVVPVRRDTKAPLVKEWQKTATTDEEQIGEWYDRWPEANVGVAMGQASKVIDIECDSPEAEDLLCKLFDGHEIITPTFESTRGVHRIFQWTDQLPNSDKANWHIGQIDFKVGGGAKGSQSVFPPSIHASGKQYKWKPGLSPAEVDPAEIPLHVIARIVGYLDNGTLFTEQQGNGKAKPKEHWDGILGGVTEGGRNNAAISIAGKWAREIDLSSQVEVQAKYEEFIAWNQRNVPPLEDSVLELCWSNATSMERTRRSTDKETRYGAPAKETHGPREGTNSEDSSWRAVLITACPPKWKLFSPLWNGHVELTIDEWLSARLAEKQILIQKNVSLDCDWPAFWSGGKKEKRGMRQKLADTSTTEEPDLEDCRDRVIANLIWSQHFGNTVDGEAPDTTGRPKRMKDGAVWFKTEYLLTQGGNLKDYPDRNEINTVLRACGVKDRVHRFDKKVAKFRVLNATGMTALENLAHKGATE